LKIQCGKTLGGGHLPNARNGIQLFFQAPDKCLMPAQNRSLERTRVQLSVDMLAYVIGSLVGV
jgi:hypothetical protein